MTSSVKLADIHPDLVPHPTQRQVLEDQTRFKVVVTGRRWGKSRLALIAAVNRIISHPEASVIWIVSPTLVDAEWLWYEATHYLRGVKHPAFKSLISPDGDLLIGTKRHRNECLLVFYNSSRIYFKAGEFLSCFSDEDEIPSLLIVDDAILVPEHAWRVILVWVMDEVKEAIFLSSPEDQVDLTGSFYQMYLAGREMRLILCSGCGGFFKKDPSKCIYDASKCEDGIVEVENDMKKKNYKTFNFSTYDNPFVPKEQLDQLVKEISNPQREVFGQFV
jgi:hypothetical protein